MLVSQFLSGIRRMAVIPKRSFGVCVPAAQKASDPIQQLFVDKIREYKSKSTGGKLVDPSPEIQKELKSELERTAKVYGHKEGVNMEDFPTLSFKEPVLDPITSKTE